MISFVSMGWRFLFFFFFVSVNLHIDWTCSTGGVTLSHLRRVSSWGELAELRILLFFLLVHGDTQTVAIAIAHVCFFFVYIATYRIPTKLWYVVVQWIHRYWMEGA